MKDKTKGNIALLVTALVWGTGFIAQKLGNEVMPPMTFNAIRQLMASFVMFPIMLNAVKKNGYLSAELNTAEELRLKHIKMFKAYVFCGAFLLFGTMTQQIGLVTVSAGKSGFISGMYIVFTPIFAIIVGKKADIKTFLCVAIAMAGFAILSLKGGLGGATAGDWWTLVSAMGFAAQIVAVDKFVDKDNDLLISVLQFFFCGTVGLLIAVLAEHPAMSSIAAGIPVLLYSTFVPTAIGYTFQIIGQKYTDSTTAALLMSLESVFALIFGAIFFKEVMSLRELLGCAVIMLAIVLDQVDIKSTGI